MSLLFQRLELAKAQWGNHPAIVEDEIRWSIGEVLEKANRLASVLVAKGVQPGDRVAMMFMNQKEFLLGFYAILRAGAVVVPINIQMPPDDIQYVLMNSGTRLLLTNETFAPNFAGSPLPLLVSNQMGNNFPSFEEAIDQGNPTFTSPISDKANQMRILMYTSGTTGKPKGVMLSEENLVHNIEGISPVLKLQNTDRILLALPLFHAYGLIIGLYGLDSRSSIVLVPNFAPKKIVQALVENQVTILPLVPTMFSVLLQLVQHVGAEKFQSLRASISGGASLPPQLLKHIEETLHIKVLEGYGLTETSPVLAVNDIERGSIPCSVGKPLPNVQIKLVDDAGNTLRWEPGQESLTGEILVKGPNIMLGYYNLPEENQQAFDSEGFLRTGDLGHFDAEGNLYISGGRKKDLIIKAGENISPVRIEQTLYQHPAIMEAAVIGVPDEKLGEEILACIQLKPGMDVTEKDLRRFCAEHLTPLMIPGHFRFYEELPKNPSGKIMKKILKEENTKLYSHPVS